MKLIKRLQILSVNSMGLHGPIQATCHKCNTQYWFYESDVEPPGILSNSAASRKPIQLDFRYCPKCTDVAQTWENYGKQIGHLFWTLIEQ